MLSFLVSLLKYVIVCRNASSVLVKVEMGQVGRVVTPFFLDIKRFLHQLLGSNLNKKMNLILTVVIFWK